jgi:hypothetical protein
MNGVASLKLPIHSGMGRSCHRRNQISFTASCAPEPGEGDWPGPLRKWVAECRASVSILHAREFFEDELNLRERLDAMIRQTPHPTKSHETNASPNLRRTEMTNNQKESRRRAPYNR